MSTYDLDDGKDMEQAQEFLETLQARIDSWLPTASPGDAQLLQDWLAVLTNSSPQDLFEPVTSSGREGMTLYFEAGLQPTATARRLLDAIDAILNDEGDRITVRPVLIEAHAPPASIQQPCRPRRRSLWTPSVASVC